MEVETFFFFVYTFLPQADYAIYKAARDCRLIQEDFALVYTGWRY